MASSILVRDIMNKDVRVVRNDTSAQEVIATMTKYDIGSILVVEGGKPTGIITVRDVLVRLVEANIPPRSVIARMIYTNPLQTIEENKTVDEAVKIMKHWKIKHLPVVNKNGELVGMVTFTDIVFKVPQMISDMQELCRYT